MAPKTTNAQYKSRLGYDSGTKPAFLRALEAQISGKPDPTRGGGQDDDEVAEWEQLDSDRPAIPRRPDAPSDDKARDADDDEEFEDERPTVVVLKEGKHLSEFEALNEKRRAKGLSPLPVPEEPSTSSPPPSSSKDTTTKKASSQQQSNVTFGARAGASKKRKLDASGDAPSTPNAKSSKDKTKADEKGKGKDGPAAKKKPKKESKSLLSFGDER